MMKKIIPAAITDKFHHDKSYKNQIRSSTPDMGHHEKSYKNQMR